MGLSLVLLSCFGSLFRKDVSLFLEKLSNAGLGEVELVGGMFEDVVEVEVIDLGLVRLLWLWFLRDRRLLETFDEFLEK